MRKPPASPGRPPLLPISCHLLELCLVITTLIHVAAATAGSATGQSWKLPALACIAAHAAVLEVKTTLRAGLLYSTRQAPSQGLLAGLLALPCLLLCAASIQPSGLWQGALQAALLSSSLIQGLLGWRSSQVQPQQQLPDDAGAGSPQAQHQQKHTAAPSVQNQVHITACMRQVQPRTCGDLLHGDSFRQRPCNDSSFATHEEGSTASDASTSRHSSNTALLHFAPAIAVWATAASSVDLSRQQLGSIAVLAAAAAGLHHFIITCIPRSFTLGEGALVACMTTLPAAHLPAALATLPSMAAATAAVLQQSATVSAGEVAIDASNAVVMLVYAVLASAGSIWGLHWHGHCRKQKLPRLSSVAALGIALALLAASAALIALLAAWTLLVFLPAAACVRLALLAAWALMLAVSLPLLQALSASGMLRRTIVRKGYHLLAIALFLPAFLADPEMLRMSLAVAFAALVALEAARCCRLPLLGHAVQAFMGRFVDSRDSGPVFVTHFTLLLGLAWPIWLSGALQGSTPAAVAPPAGATAAAASGEAGFGGVQVLLCAMSGIMVIGVGDAAASAVGSAYGRVRLCWGSSKTLEGAIAGVLCTLLSWALLLVPQGLLGALPTRQLLGLVCSTVWACLLEAATSQLDNLVVPAYYLVHMLAVLQQG